MRRYSVANATGKEVAIFDLYPDTGEPGTFCVLVSLGRLTVYLCSATNIVAKHIFSHTETGSPVAVMCNSTAVCPQTVTGAICDPVIVVSPI